MKKIFGILFTFSMLLFCASCGRNTTDRKLELISHSQQKEVMICTVGSVFSSAAIDPENSYDTIKDYQSYEAYSIFFSSEFSLWNEDIVAVYKYLKISTPELSSTAVAFSRSNLKTYNLSYTVEGETIVRFDKLTDATGMVGIGLVADMDVYEFRYVNYSSNGKTTLEEPFTIMLCYKPELTCVVL